MKIVGLYCILNVRIQFAGYHTETQCETALKTKGCAQSGGYFILPLWIHIFELSCRLQNLYSLLKAVQYAFI
jgi:hypothetical protein